MELRTDANAAHLRGESHLLLLASDLGQNETFLFQPFVERLDGGIIVKLIEVFLG